MKTKKEFLNFLDKRLSILKEEEKNEVLNEYSQHIDMKVQEGQSEEDAIKNFGNLDDFVDEILDAYNINSAYNKKNIETEKITEAIDTGVDAAKTFFQRVREYIKGISNYILNEKPSKILIFLMKIGILSVALFIACMLGSFVLNIIKGIFNIGIVNILLKIVYFCFCVSLIVSVLGTFISNHLNGYIEDSDKECSVKEEKTKSVKIHKNVNCNFTKLMGKIIMLCVKIGLIFIFIPFVFGLCCSIVGMGIGFVLSIMSYPTVGLTLIALGVNISGIAATLFVLRCVYGIKIFDKGGNKDVQ